MIGLFLHLFCIVSSIFMCLKHITYLQDLPGLNNKHVSVITVLTKNIVKEAEKAGKLQRPHSAVQK